MGCDSLDSCLINTLQISIHAPIVGCDLQELYVLTGLEAISIHAPIVGCDIILCFINNKKVISIHAPIVGCDKIKTINIKPIKNFNPRTHRGVRQNVAMSIAVKTKISIHAPIVGCDILTSAFKLRISYFNPRTHRGVRPQK